ncbi:hypothetical protein L873DRAFT_1666006, partial [Choiromyces venosus 120613-1]
LSKLTLVEINGRKVTVPDPLLCEAIKGDHVSPSQVLGFLESEFSTPSLRSAPRVVLMDELDQLVTKGQDVMYNLFNWPGGRHSKLIVPAVANTMGLPERTPTIQLSLIIGFTRITFLGYTHFRLMSIILSSLEGASGNIVHPEAVQFASRKVAAVSGDARRALDICRRALEIVNRRILFQQRYRQQPTPIIPFQTKSGAISPSNATGSDLKARGRVTIAVVKQAIQEATSSPLQIFLKSPPSHPRFSVPDSCCVVDVRELTKMC